MHKHALKFFILFTILFYYTQLPAREQTDKTGSPGQPLYTVLNPTGYPPVIERRPLAPRPQDLRGKTIYLVDITFNNGDVLLTQMQSWLARNLPDINTIIKVKRGAYGADDPELWEEIRLHHGMMVMAIGH